MRFIVLALSIFLITGCNTSKKFFKRGQYDIAIKRAVKKLHRKPDSKKDIVVLEKAYVIANQRDLDRIKYLKTEAKPETWPEIFERYSRLKKRQNLVRSVLPIELPDRTVDFEYVDYDLQIVEAKERAAAFHYDHAINLLENNDKSSAREAYYHLQSVKEYFNDYKNTDELSGQAREKGMSRAVITVTDDTRFQLTDDFLLKLMPLNVSEFCREWIEYYRAGTENVTFDYKINIILENIDVSPEKELEQEIRESRKVDDGFEYVLDENGNVMKDSLGNDIKVPVTKIIHCTLVKSTRQKAVHLEGRMEYIDLFTNSVLKTVPVAADKYFEHVSAIAAGEIEALSPENRELVGVKPLPFPSDSDMIYQAGDIIRTIVEEVLYDNRRYLH